MSERIIWNGEQGTSETEKKFKVTRHGEGRKYWEAHYPDGTHTDTFTTQAAARASCESWKPDDTMVTLIKIDEQIEAESQQESTTLDEAIAAAKKALGEVVRVLNSEDIRDRRQKHLQNLRALGTAREVIELAVTESVRGARETERYSGWYDYGPPTWERIGKALGVTKQAAQGRYGKKN